MSNLKAALKVFGLSDADIESLQSETPPDGFDPKDLATKAREHIIEVHETANPRIKDEDVQGKIIQAQKDIKFKVAKELGFTQTRGELEKMPIDDFTALVKAANESLTSKITGDEKLKADLAEFRDKYLKANQELENVLSSKDSEILKVKAEAKREVQIFTRKAIIAREAGKIDLSHYPESVRASMMKTFEDKVDQMPWTIHDDGALTGENGEGLAIDFDKKGSFKHISEAMAKEWQDALRKSNGNGGAGDAPIVVAGVDVSKVVTNTNKETLERLKVFTE